MKRSSLLVKFGRMIQKFPLWLLQFIERPFLRQVKHESPSPKAIIIFGLPRSGSTVTYQTICHALQVNYLSNFWNIFYQLPLVGGFVSYYISRSHRSNFRSQYGFVSGLDGPAEGMKFWKWWLDCGLQDQDCHCLSPSLTKKRSEYLQRILVSLGSFTGLPFATGYLGHILVPDRVYQTFPGSVFIRVRRDPVLNALSILKSMQNGGYNWFSVKPDECRHLDDISSHERVASQVYWLNRRLDAADCAHSMFSIEYEELCVDPEKQIKKLLVWCATNGLSVNRKYALPATLEKNVADIRDDDDVKRIRAALMKLEIEFGKLK